MPKLGFNVLNWTAGVSDDLFPIVDRLQKIGYDGIEHFVGDADPAACRRLGAHLRSIGMDVTSVQIVGADANPVSKDAAVRRKALARLRMTIDRAVDVGSKVICGPMHSAFATFTRDEPRPEEYKRSAEVLHAAGEYAAKAGVVLAIEALNRFECYLCNTMVQLRELIELTDHPNIRAMYDTHHANMEEKKPAVAIKHIAPVLVHVHLSENDRGTPGDGHVNFQEALATLAKLKYDGWLTIEAFSRADPGFANAINVWREYSKPWDVAEKGHRFLRREIAAATFPKRKK